MKGMHFFGVHRASGYPADTLVHMYHTFLAFFVKMYQSLKCSDEETGKCASNLMIGYRV
jgi:hypothetical protein